MTVRFLLAALSGALAVLGAAPGTRGAELYAGNDIDLRWDNTLRYSSAVRVSSPSPTLLRYPNADDGDRNFSPGLVSNRLDIASQFDAARDGVGLHVSAAAWYDSVYHSRTDNRAGGATYNGASGPSSRFAPAVRDLHGQYAELDNAFVYGTFDLAETPLSVRLGRQTVLWGESLFYDTDSIASAQAPADHTRTVTGQSSYSNNVYLPVTQLSLTAQLLPNIAVTLYDQFEARPSRQAGDGSYFSYVDFLGPGAGRLFLRSGEVLMRRRDGKVSGGGRYGAAVHASLGDIDVGVYAIRYNSTDPQIVTTPDEDAGEPRMVEYYKLVYPKGITLFGASGSVSIGDGTIAGEFSLRRNMPILPYPPGGSTSAGGSRYGGYLRGDLLHAQASAQKSFGRADLWDSADLSVELATDDVAAITRGIASSNLSRFAMKARILFEAHRFEVLPNLDLTFPVGIGYNLTGHSFTYYAQNGGTGDFQFGVSALYRSTWKASLTMTGFIGAPRRQPLADRDVVVASLERTF